MAEFEELRLSVILIDNASQGLATLRQNLRALGGGENREALTRMQQQVEGLSGRMEKAGVQMTRTAQAAYFLGRTIGTAAMTFATAFVSNFALDSLKKFTDEMVRLDGLAKAIGVGGGNIKNVVDQMRLMGIDAGAASGLVRNFTTALAELSRTGSALRQQLMQGAISDPAAMQAWIARMTGFANRGELEKALNEFVEGANNAFENELRRTGSRPMAAELRNRMLKAFGVDDETYAKIKGRFTELTAAEEEEFNRRMKIAQSFSLEMSKMDLKSEEFIRGLQISLLPILQEINKEIGNMGEAWGKALGESVSKDIRKITSEVLFLYKLITDPKAAIKEGLKSQAGQAHPTLQKFLGVETTEENRQYWEEQRKKGNLTIWDNPFAPDIAGPEGSTPMTPPPRSSLPPLPPGVAPAVPDALKRMSLTSGDNYSRGSGGMQEFTRAIRTGVFEGMVDFKNFLNTGSKSGGAGAGTGEGAGGGGGGGMPGFQRASLTTGGDGGNFQIPGGGSIPSNIGRGTAPYGSSVGPGVGEGAGDTPAGGGAAGVYTPAPGAGSLVPHLRGIGPAPGAGSMENEARSFAPAPGAGSMPNAPGFGPAFQAGEMENERSRFSPAFQAGAMENQIRGFGPAFQAGEMENEPGSFAGFPRGFEPAAGAGSMENESRRRGSTTNTSKVGSGDQPVPAAIIERARAVAQLGPGPLSQWMAKQGYPQHAQWCGDFAASVVKSAGGTPPKNWSLASNWRTVGPEVSAQDAQPGDIAVARPGWSRRGSGRTGDVGSHVTILDEMKGKKFSGLGGNQSRRVSQYNVSQYQFYRPAGTDENTAVARRNMDRDMGREVRSRSTDFSGRVRVDVRAPSGTKVEADGTGPFKNIEMNRMNQMQPAQSGPEAFAE